MVTRLLLYNLARDNRYWAIQQKFISENFSWADRAQNESHELKQICQIDILDYFLHNIWYKVEEQKYLKNFLGFSNNFLRCDISKLLVMTQNEYRTELHNERNAEEVEFRTRHTPIVNPNKLQYTMGAFKNLFF